MISLHADSKMTEMNLSPKQNETHIEKRLVVVVGFAGGEMGWEFEISRCKLLYTEWINNIVLLYSTGNSFQYPVIINHNGKEYKVCVCM